jgi:hypothetical protein
VWFANHHSAYPTTTEVNGTVLATGVFPQRSGILANNEYRPEIDPLRPFGSQSLTAVRRGDQLSGGKYLYFSPGLSYDLSHAWQLYAYLQLPLYQYVNGVQLTADWAALAGVAWRF